MCVVFDSNHWRCFFSSSHDVSHAQPSLHADGKKDIGSASCHRCFPSVRFDTSPCLGPPPNARPYWSVGRLTCCRPPPPPLPFCSLSHSKRFGIIGSFFLFYLPCENNLWTLTQSRTCTVDICIRLCILSFWLVVLIVVPITETGKEKKHTCARTDASR